MPPPGRNAAGNWNNSAARRREQPTWATGTRGYLCVVVNGEGAERFVVTVYFTGDVKQGNELWTR
jgi:hypothetical protein